MGLEMLPVNRLSLMKVPPHIHPVCKFQFHYLGLITHADGIQIKLTTPCRVSKACLQISECNKGFRIIWTHRLNTLENGQGLFCIPFSYENTRHLQAYQTIVWFMFEDNPVFFERFIQGMVIISEYSCKGQAGCEICNPIFLWDKCLGVRRRTLDPGLLFFMFPADMHRNSVRIF